MPNLDRSVAVIAAVFVLLCATSAATQDKKKGSGQGSDTSSTPSGGKPSSGGASTPDPNAPVPIETYTLAYNAMRADAIKIANRITESVGAFKAATASDTNPRIIIFDRTTFDDVDGLRVAQLEIDVLNREVCNIVTPPGGGAEAAAGPDVLSGVGSIISATASLLQAVTPDSTAMNSDAKIPITALATEVARALHAKSAGLHIFLPHVYVPLPQLEAAPDLSGCPYSAAPASFFDAYRNLTIAYTRAQTLLVTDKPRKLNDSEKTALKTILSRIDSLRNQLEGAVPDASAGGPAQKPKGKGSGKPLASDRATSSPAADENSSSDNAESTPPPAVSPLVRFARIHAFLESTLKSCQASDNKAPCYVLYLRAGQAGGGTIVKKWVFHPTWYYYSGGASSSYALLDLGTGELRTSGTVSTVTNYMKLGTFQDEYSTQRRFDSHSEKEIDLNKDGNDEDH
jgi:hypothetical protein